jgi:hypothetical protein
MQKLIWIVFYVLIYNCATAQVKGIADSSINKNIQIQYLHSETLEGTMIDGEPYNRLLGNVALIAIAHICLKKKIILKPLAMCKLILQVAHKYLANI